MLRDDRFVSHIVEQEAPRSVSILRHTRREPFLPNQGRRLISQTAHNRYFRKNARGNNPVSMRIGRRNNSRQMDLPLDAKEIQEEIIIQQRMQIHKHCPGRVCRIRDKNIRPNAPIQTIDKPRIDRPKRQRPPLERLLHLGHMRQHPEQFRRGGVGRQWETADGLEAFCAGFLLQLGDDGLGAGVCPDDGVVEGLAGLVVPDYGCFALVGDAHALDAVAGVAGVFKVADCFFDAGFYRRDEFEWVVLVPAGYCVG